MKIIKARTTLRKYKIYIGSDIFKNLKEIIKKNLGQTGKMMLGTNEKIYGIYKEKIDSFLNIDSRNKVIISIIFGKLIMIRCN